MGNISPRSKNKYKSKVSIDQDFLDAHKISLDDIRYAIFENNANSETIASNLRSLDLNKILYTKLYVLCNNQEIAGVQNFTCQVYLSFIDHVSECPLFQSDLTNLPNSLSQLCTWVTDKVQKQAMQKLYIEYLNKQMPGLTSVLNYTCTTTIYINENINSYKIICSYTVPY